MSRRRRSMGKMTSSPGRREGSHGDIRVSETNLGTKVYVKNGATWKSTLLSTETEIIGTSATKIGMNSNGDFTVNQILLTGKITLASKGTGANNVCIGTGQTDGGENNISIGVDAGKALTTNGDENIFIGTEAGKTITNSAFVIGIGYQALTVYTGLTNLGHTVAIGHEAGHDCTNGLQNVFLGSKAGTKVIGGDSNICIGYNAAATLQGGNNNTIIGDVANVSANAAAGQIAIGYGVTCTGNYDITVGAGTNTASLCLDGADTGWAAASSDERFKENITTSVAGLSFINDLRPVTYNWKKKKDAPIGTIYYEEGSNEPCLGYSYGKTLHGFIAQEVKVAIDNHSELKEGFAMWRQYDNGVQTVADGNLIPILTKAVQELSTKIDTMQEEINTLKTE